MIAELEQVIEEQRAEIGQLLARIARYENGPATEPAGNRPVPRIF